jgi:hypothetical protein
MTDHMKKPTQMTLKISDKTRTATKPDGTKIPVLDGTYDFLVQPNEDDIKYGIPGDHAQCMYCLACKRMYGSDMVYVTRGLAYVELRGKGGRHELRRFILTDPASTNVKRFDAKEEVSPQAVVFAAPKGARRLDAQVAAWHRWVARQKKYGGQKAYVKGTARGKGHTIKPLADTLRDPATGMFQFATKRKSG